MRYCTTVRSGNLVLPEELLLMALQPDPDHDAGIEDSCSIVSDNIHEYATSLKLAPSSIKMASNSHSSSKAGTSAAGLSPASSSNNRNTSGASKSQQQQPSQVNPLCQRFPVNSLQEITLQTGENLSGRVYCTDEMTGSIVIQTALVHTTLATEIRVISSESVVSSVEIPEAAASVTVAATPLTQPLPKIHKKALEDRERRAVKLAEESLRHINQKVRSSFRKFLLIGRFQKMLFVWPLTYS